MVVAAKEPVGARVAYWRGFALWRRAFNGFNDGVDRAEIEQDLLGAIREFDKALSEDRALVDATIGTISCLQSLALPASAGRNATRDRVAVRVTAGTGESGRSR
jgi:hypothetical protein